VEVSIQAVSPELILSTLIKVGSVGAAAVSAHAICIDNIKTPRMANRDNLLISANLP
jgi:hypothetical protein